MSPRGALGVVHRVSADRTLWRFLLVGVGMNVFGFVVFRAILALLGGARSAVGMAQALTYAIGIVLGYALNRRWTFRSDGAHGRQFPRFVAMHLGGLALSSTLLQVAAATVPLPVSVLWVIVTGAVSVASFVVQRTWVFRTA